MLGGVVWTSKRLLHKLRELNLDAGELQENLNCDAFLYLAKRRQDAVPTRERHSAACITSEFHAAALFANYRLGTTTKNTGSPNEIARIFNRESLKTIEGSPNVNFL